MIFAKFSLRSARKKERERARRIFPNTLADFSPSFGSGAGLLSIHAPMRRYGRERVLLCPTREQNLPMRLIRYRGSRAIDRASPRNNLTPALAVAEGEFAPPQSAEFNNTFILVRATLGLSFSRITVAPLARASANCIRVNGALSLRRNQLLLNGVFARSIGQTRSDQARVRPPRLTLSHTPAPVET